MPYKDKDKKRACYKRWYEKHKETHIKNVGKRKKEQKKKAKAWITKYKRNHPCKKCSETHPACLVFHHISGIKDKCVSIMVGYGYSIDRIKKEVEKCEVLCANCHRKWHWKNRGSMV